MANETAPRRWLRTKAAADHAGLSSSNLEKRRVTGDGPAYSTIGRVVVYDVNELDRWIADRQQQSTAENEAIAA